MITPAQEYRRIEVRKPSKLHSGLDGVTHGFLGTFHRRPAVYADLAQQAAIVDVLSERWSDKSDHRLREALFAFREKFRKQDRDRDSFAVPALAAIREAAARQTGLRPFRVQLLGALALHRGMLAEMATGEGKTLTAALAATLAGWTGRPCHIVTVNDYLAQRDAEWFEALYRFCGVSVGHVTSAMDPTERRRNYDRDVAYTTSKEIVADFLRDRIRLGATYQPGRRLIRQLLDPRAGGAAGLVMRGLDTAIVDEADSVLVDEAVTPLIISQARDNPMFVDAWQAARDIAIGLEEGVDYRINLRYREVELLAPDSPRLAERCAGLPGIWRGAARRRELLEQALTARQLFHLGKQYVIQEGKVVIVDEFTGRMMQQRQWQAGLHQAIEAKENLVVTPPTETLARLSFQRFFRLFRRLAGMTGTAQEATGEFWHIYSLPVMFIPTNRPCIREILPDRFFARAEDKWAAVAGEVETIHATGRPILIGTRSIEASEHLAARLAARGLSFNLLNAVRHREEAQIVAEAGLFGKITIATNMAGRGTDILLARGVPEAGGLHVIATERHEAGRIDRQLFGRCARQGDPGSAQAFVSVEDELLRRFVPAAVRRRLSVFLDRSPEQAWPLAQAAVRYAQAAAQRLAFKQRRNVLSMDTWLDEALSFAGSDPGRS